MTDFRDHADPMEIAKLVTLPEQEWRVELVKKLLNLEKRVDENTDITADTQAQNAQDFKEVKDILGAMKAGMVFFGWIGKLVKWLTIIAVGFTALVAAVKAGESLPELLQHFRGGK